MKNLGAYPDVSFPAWSDYQCAALASSVGSIVTGNLDTGSSAPQYVKIATNVPCWFNARSTGANIPTTAALAGQATNQMVPASGELQTQIPGGSTGWSLCFGTTGAAGAGAWASLSFFKR